MSTEIRTIKSKMRESEMIPLYVQSDGTCSHSQVTVTKNGNGDFTIAFDRPFQEKPYVVVKAIAGASDKVYEQVPADNWTASSIQVEIRNISDGSLADKGFCALICGSHAGSPKYLSGWQSESSKILARRSRLMYFEFDGTNQYGSHKFAAGTVTNPSTGNYTLALKWPSYQNLMVFAMSDDATDQCQVATVSKTGATFKLYNSVGTAHDGVIHILAIAIDALGNWHNCYPKSAKYMGRGPVLYPFDISTTAINRGGGYFTFTDQGVGDFDLTFKCANYKPAIWFGTPVNDDPTVFRLGNPLTESTSSTDRTFINVAANGDTPIQGLAIGFNR